MIWHDLGLSLYCKENNITIQKVPGTLGYNDLISNPNETILLFEGEIEEYRILKTHEIFAAYNTAIDSDILISGIIFKADCLSRAKIFASAVYVSMNPTTVENQLIEVAPNDFRSLSPEEIVYASKVIQWFINSRTEKKNIKLTQIKAAETIAELSLINWGSDGNDSYPIFDDFFYPANSKTLKEHIEYDSPRWETFNQMKTRIYDLELRLTNIEAKESGDIELVFGEEISIYDFSENIGYTVINDYGGIVSWTPSSLLGLLPSGTLWINGVQRSQVAGLAGVISDSAEVKVNDIITSSGMSQVNYTPKVQKQ